MLVARNFAISQAIFSAKVGPSMAAMAPTQASTHASQDGHEWEILLPNRSDIGGCAPFPQNNNNR